jgi:hypothetical protein
MTAKRAKKLLDEINRIADNLGVGEIVVAAREHLKKIGEIPDEPARPRGGSRRDGPGDRDGGSEWPRGAPYAG